MAKKKEFRPEKKLKTNCVHCVDTCLLCQCLFSLQSSEWQIHRKCCHLTRFFNQYLIHIIVPPKWPQLATLLIFSILFVLLLLLLVFVITLQVVLSITTTDFILPPTDWLQVTYFQKLFFIIGFWKFMMKFCLAVLSSRISLQQISWAWHYKKDIFWK